MAIAFELEGFLMNLNTGLLGDVVLEGQIIDLDFQITDHQSRLETKAVASQSAIESLELDEVVLLGGSSVHKLVQERLEVLEVLGDFGRVVWVEKGRISCHSVENCMHPGQNVVGFHEAREKRRVQGPSEAFRDTSHGKLAKVAEVGGR